MTAKKVQVEFGARSGARAFGAAAFLLSGAASFVTGSALSVEGGPSLA